MQQNNHPFVSPRNAVFFIAEIGGNHEGNFNEALRLVTLASESGADAVKFQFYTGDSLVSKIEGSDRNAHFKKFELADSENLELIRLVKEAGAMPMASVWSEEMLVWSDPELPMHKIGSGDLTCYPMLAAIAATNKPIILSTGLASLKEVGDAVSYIEKCNPSYVTERKLALLQCTSSYPTPDHDANINAMLTLRSEFGLPVGYSDHTLGVDAIEAAVTVGAELIEKHFTDTREGKTFRDHLIALTRDEVRATLEKMERIKNLLGGSRKELTNSEREAEHHISFRRSLYLTRDMKAGEKILEGDLKALRPMHGICASEFENLVGRVVRENVYLGHALQEQDLER